LTRNYSQFADISPRKTGQSIFWLFAFMGLQDLNHQAGHHQPPTNDLSEMDSGRDSGNESEKITDTADV
jgi:hypothetical protein